MWMQVVCLIALLGEVIPGSTSEEVGKTPWEKEIGQFQGLGSSFMLGLQGSWGSIPGDLLKNCVQPNSALSHQKVGEAPKPSGMEDSRGSGELSVCLGPQLQVNSGGPCGSGVGQSQAASATFCESYSPPSLGTQNYLE